MGNLKDNATVVEGMVCPLCNGEVERLDMVIACSIPAELGCGWSARVHAGCERTIDEIWGPRSPR